MNEILKNIASPKIQVSRIFSNNQSTKTVITLCVFICVSFNLWAQTSQQPANPKRTVLYTLAPNEVIFGKEYAISSILNAYKFALITRNEQTEIFKFIFNGKVITEMKGIEREKWGYNIINVFYLNLFSDKGYAFAYQDNGKGYINIQGHTDGPYEYIYGSDDLSWDYRYKEAGNEKVSKIQIEGNTFNNNKDEEISLRSSNQIHSFYSNLKNDYVIIDTKKVGKSPALQVHYDERTPLFGIP